MAGAKSPSLEEAYREKVKEAREVARQTLLKEREEATEQAIQDVAATAFLYGALWAINRKLKAKDKELLKSL